MNNRNFLLTFDKNGISTYAWLESEDEMKNMIEELSEDVVIHDKLELYQVREIE
ncbi:hypothetical protein [Paenibacillus dendritiformis]|uniref:hypothetical protein n=1 Tax=Paenibacillus dendritiformis TaxID=130049 RepID=UPI00387E1E8A